MDTDLYVYICNVCDIYMYILMDIYIYIYIYILVCINIVYIKTVYRHYVSVTEEGRRVPAPMTWAHSCQIRAAIDGLHHDPDGSDRVGTYSSAKPKLLGRVCL
jgi:hypothetical protein